MTKTGKLYRLIQPYIKTRNTFYIDCFGNIITDGFFVPINSNKGYYGFADIVNEARKFGYVIGGSYHPSGNYIFSSVKVFNNLTDAKKFYAENNSEK